MTRRTVLVFAIVLTIALSLLAGCDRAPQQITPDPDFAGGELIFADDFSGTELADHWRTGFEGWRVESGALRVQGARNDALWLQEPLPETFRLTFTARSDSEAGDLKFEILGDGATHESGYVGIFGGWHNRLNIIARLDEHGDDRHVGAQGIQVEPGRTYEFAVLRNDHRLRWYIDGVHFLTYDDPEPLRGEDHRFFGFNNWETDVTFQDLRIYDLNH